MRTFGLSLALLLGLNSLALADLTQQWTDLAAKRKALTSYHQEFDRTTSITTRDHVRSSKRSITLDGSGARWREHTVSGAGDWIYLYNGSGLFHLDAGEYTRQKLARDNDPPEPAPYNPLSLDLRKGVEVKRVPCGLSGVDHECILLDFALKPKSGPPQAPKLIGGATQVIIDSVTGLIVFSQSIQDYQRRDEPYRSIITIQAKRMSWNASVDEAFFRIPSGYTEVKELSKWNAEKMKKELTGKPAPELALVDINGKAIELSGLRGRTVLLDFWATWCGPCRADAPSLDKLYRKYSGKNLSIIGLSVDEDHATVQKYLNEHPHAYSVALTTENEIPRAYRVGVFPTYVIIDPAGNFAYATEGDRGFSTLKKLLKKAGLDTD